jgi:hypothetical protein
MGKGIEKIFRILDLAKKHLRAFGEQMFETVVLDTRVLRQKLSFYGLAIPNGRRGFHLANIPTLLTLITYG